MASSGCVDTQDLPAAGATGADPLATVGALETAFTGRGAGTDAERRAARWLADRLSAPQRDVLTETFWCRPNWALAHAWHVALAVAGSLISLASPIAGLCVLAIALAAVVADGLAQVSLGRRLTPERASQNVVASTRQPSGATTRLVLTANYDAGHMGLAYRIRPTTSRLTKALHGVTPGWLGWIAIAIVWLLVIAILRQTGHTSHAVGAIQFPPTVGLVLAFALLLELGTGGWSPAGGDNAGGVAAVLELADALAAAPPRNLDVEIVLSGAGDGDQIGLRRYLRAHPHKQTVVLALSASGSGNPCWWVSDGAFLPLPYSPALKRTAAQIAADEPHLRLTPHRGRGNTGAYAARARGLPAITIGGSEQSHSHRKTDGHENVDRASLDRTIQLALLLVDAIDGAAASPRPA